MVSNSWFLIAGWFVLFMWQNSENTVNPGPLLEKSKATDLWTLPKNNDAHTQSTKQIFVFISMQQYYISDSNTISPSQYRILYKNKSLKPIHIQGLKPLSCAHTEAVFASTQRSSSLWEQNKVEKQAQLTPKPSNCHGQSTEMSRRCRSAPSAFHKMK